MSTSIKTPVLAAALIVLTALSSSNETRAQDAAMVYASSVTATQSLNDIDTTVTPQRLAREFSRDLVAELDTRLPQEQSELLDMRRIKNAFNDSILEDLDTRLKQEMRNLTASFEN